MLEELFGTPYRADLIKLFLNNPESTLTTKAIAKSIGSTTAKTNTELKQMVSFGLIKRIPVAKEYSWQLVPDFPLIPELRALIIKSVVLMERELSRRISQLKGVKLLVFTGVFVGQPELGTDILLVGAVDRKALQRLMGHVTKEFGHDLRFTVLSKVEYTHRREMTDKFLYEILNNQPIVALEKL
jgi:hypothetical protein